MGVCVGKFEVGHVNKEAEVSEEISNEDSLLDVGDDEDPR